MRRSLVAVLSILLSFPVSVTAQEKAKTQTPPAKPAAEAPAPPAASKPVPSKPALAAKKIPDDYKLNMLIRSTIIAINQANKTSNYTVLRDLSAPGFKQANTAEKLAETFAGLRTTKLDLSPILFFSPKLTAKPGLMDNGMLRLTGYFDTRPQRVKFDLAFEDNQGEWLLYGVSIGTKLAPPASAQVNAPTPQATAPAAAKPAETEPKKK